MKTPTYDQGVCFSMTSIFGVSLHSLWEAVTSAAPSWSLVPPILIGAASLVGAVMSGIKAHEEIRDGCARRAEERELHQIRVRREKALSIDCGFDGLEGRT